MKVLYALVAVGLGEWKLNSKLSVGERYKESYTVIL